MRALRCLATAALVSMALATNAFAAGASPAAHRAAFDNPAARPWWQHRIDELVAGRPVSVTIGDDGAFWYRHLAGVQRIPASNEKLLLSMTLLAAVGADRAIPTRAMAEAAPVDGIVDGNLWIVGHGDPEMTPDRLDALAERVAEAGITRITGSVVGDTGPFARDWWAPGWRDDFPREEIPFPTALTFRGNLGPEGRHIPDPEARAASYLTKSLGRHGVEVRNDPKVSAAKSGLVKIAAVDSAPMIDILRRMDVDSINFDAEVLGKVLGAETSGTGSIAAGAAAIDAFAAANGAPEFEHHDSSGLSYANRVTTLGMVRLLFAADDAPWAAALRRALPTGGQGTLRERLGRLRVRAKTGTLTAVSALSGWVWSERAGGWVEFSILSDGMGKDEAVRIEDAIVRIVSGVAAGPRRSGRWRVER
jgi:D-alanyl-D-alanine carboxypeptidase/D-alanyl-D-alanine-endopeptidase (penicillin-binding protein 4)